MPRVLSPVLLVLGLVAGCSQGEPSRPAAGTAGVQVSDALCRPTPKGRQMTGCYLTLTAAGDDRLVSVASPVAARIEIHESRIESGMMMMSQLREGMPLPAGQTVRLTPGGDHIMLLGVVDPLNVGDVVPLTLTFEKAGAQDVQARVARPDVATAP